MHFVSMCICLFPLSPPYPLPLPPSPPNSFIVLCIMTVICQSQSCSIGNFPRMIAISNANEIWTVDSYPALLLSQTASLCNGTVKKWRFCHTVIHSSGMADVIPNKISVGVWRPSDSNVYTLVDGSLVLLPLLKTYFQLDFLCKSFSVTPVDIMAGDSVGLVLHSTPSVFGILGANISGSNGVCVGTVEGDGYRFVNPNCSRSRYDFLLQGLTGTVMPGGGTFVSMGYICYTIKSSWFPPSPPPPPPPFYIFFVCHCL